jgi:hypothetical protein
MAYSVDYSGDWAYVDGIESMTLTPKPSGTARSIHGCRMTVSNPAGAGGGDYQPEPTSTVFYVWAAGLSGSVPKVGDELTDGAAVVWVVRDVTRQSDVSQWGLTCSRKL